MKKKKIVTVISLILIAGLTAYMLYPVAKTDDSTVKAGGSRSRVLPVNIYVVNPHGLTDVYPANSELRASEEVDLSFEASGRITEILFDEGTHVKKDQLLAKVNDARLQAQLKKLEAQLELYNSKEFRQKSLLEREAVSQQAYDESHTNVEITRADIDLVRAQIRETELRAPFDGFIGLRNVSEGAYVNPATVIAKLTKNSPLRLEVSVPEKFIKMIKHGSDLSFRLDSDTAFYTAKVYAIESASSDIHTFTVRAHYPNVNGEIPANTYASILLKLDYRAEGISVPSESVIPEMGKQVVYRVNSGRAKRTEIETGIRTESFVQVIGGLNVGDTVITTGIMQLRDGIPVTVVKSENRQNQPDQK
jgi:membrane fusion protein (multidrug efflux system)